MAYNTYTTTDLVNNILLVSHAPTGQDTFSTTQVLTLADRELQTPILKQILSTRGGYYKTYQDYDIAADGLYVIPTDAIAGALDNVQLIQDPTIIPCEPIDEPEQFSTISPTSTSYGFFMQGNSVQILPIPNVGKARLWYYQRPSKLIPTSQASQITSINGAVFTVASVPSNITTGAFVDVAGDQPPFNVLGQGTILSIVGTTITLDTVISNVNIGDWIALNKQTPIPQLPVEFRPLLEQRVVAKIYEIQGYMEKMNAALNSLKELEAATFSMISPRVNSKTKVINPVDGGFLSGNRNRFSNFPTGK